MKLSKVIVSVDGSVLAETAVLSVEEIRRQLSASVVGRQLYLFGEVESANVVLRSLARQGAIEGTVVLVDSQTGGRGRLGQPWFSPGGVNLYASVLFRPSFHPREAAKGQRADVVVMGTHGRTDLGALLPGERGRARRVDVAVPRDDGARQVSGPRSGAGRRARRRRTSP